MSETTEPEPRTRTAQRLPLTLSLTQAAREYGFDRGTLAEAIHRGDLPASCLNLGRRYRKYRIFRSDIERWIRAHRVKPRGVRPGPVRDPVVRKQLDREHNKNRVERKD